MMTRWPSFGIPAPMSPEGSRRLAGLLAFLLPLLVHLPVVLGLRTLWFNDVTELHVPVRAFFGRAWAAGEFPLWCPEIYLGFPLFAEGQAGPLYFLNWPLFAALPAWWGVGLSFALHLGLASLGTFLWLSGRLRPLPALVGGLIFGLSGHMALHHMHLNLVQALAWLPWCLFAVDRLFREGRPRDMGLLTVFLSLLVLCGHPQTAVFAFGVVGCYSLLSAIGRREEGEVPTWGSLLGVFLAMAFAAGISQAQVQPLLELARGSVREGGIAGQMAQHLTPQALAVLAVPSAFGTPGEATNWLHPGGLWRAGIELHIGLVAVWAVALAGCSPRRRAAWVLALTLALVVLVSMGPLLVGVETLFQVPPLRSLRFPDRLMGSGTLLLAGLAAMGLDAALDRPLSARQRLVSLTAVLLPLVVVLLVTYRRGLAPGDPLRAELIRDLSIQALSLVAASGVLSPALRSRWRMPLMIVALVLPLADHHLRQVPTARPEYWDPPSTVRSIEGDLCRGDPYCLREDRLERIVFRSPPAPYLEVGWNRRPVPPDPLAGLAYNLPMLYGLQAVDGILPLRQQSFLRLYKPMADHPGRSLGTLGGRYVVTPRPHDAPSLSRPLPVSGPVGVYRDREGLPRTFAVHQAEVVPDPEATARRVAQGSRRLRNRVLLPYLPPLALGEPPRGTASGVRVVSYRNDEVTLEARMAADGLVVLLDSYAPGWEVFVDEIPAPILPANGVFRAVPVPEGTHQVEFRYRPASVRRGAALSLWTLALLAGLLAFEVLWMAIAGSPLRPFASPELEGDGDLLTPRFFHGMALVLVAWVVVSMIRHWDRWHRAFQVWPGPP